MVDGLVLTSAERAGHARELVRDYDISSIDGIVISSGDGLVYEASVCMCVRMVYRTCFYICGTSF